MLSLVFFWGVFQIVSGERIQVHQGFGYDGVIYADTVSRLEETVFLHPAPDKRIQRFLPSAILHYSLKALGMDFSPEHIVRGFQILNFLLVLISVFLYWRISDRLRFLDGARWVGFFALFCNFATARMPYFNPVLTDTGGFFLGMLLLYFFLEGSDAGLWCTGLAGAFTWPTIPFYALFLLSFKKIPAAGPVKNKGLVTAATLALTALFVSLMKLSYDSLGAGFLAPVIDPGAGTLRADASLAIPAFLAVLVTVFFVFYAMADDKRLYDPVRMLKEFRPLAFLSAALLLLGVFWFVRHFSAPTVSTPMRYGYIGVAIAVSLTRSVALPLIFLLSHLVYYGPVVYLALFFWKDFARASHEQGLGLLVCVFFWIFTLLPNSESRHFLDFFPFLAVFTVHGLERVKWKSADIALFVAVSLLFSKVWLSLNASSDLSVHFMNFGPWMPERYYRLQGYAALVTGAGFWLWLAFSGKFNTSGDLL